MRITHYELYSGREAKRKQRLLARAAGKCITCCLYPRDTGRATCWRCRLRRQRENQLVSALLRAYRAGQIQLPAEVERELRLEA